MVTLLAHMIKQSVASFEGKPFSARTMARRVGAEPTLVERELDRLTRNGGLRRTAKRSSYPNGMTVILYQERETGVAMDLEADRRC